MRGGAFTLEIDLSCVSLERYRGVIRDIYCGSAGSFPPTTLLNRMPEIFVLYADWSYIFAMSSSVVNPKVDTNKNHRLALRLSGEQKAMIETVADLKAQSVSEFVLQSALDRAAAEFLDRTNFVLTNSQWEDFLAVLDQPSTPNPGLEKLLQFNSVFVD